MSYSTLTRYAVGGGPLVPLKYMCQVKRHGEAQEKANMEEMAHRTMEITLFDTYNYISQSQGHSPSH